MGVKLTLLSLLTFNVSGDIKSKQTNVPKCVKSPNSLSSSNASWVI
jgi:hypothetical protein